MAKPAALTVAILVAGAMLVAAGVAAALVLLGNDIFGPSDHALSQAQVRDELAAQRSTPGPGASSGAPGGHPSTSPPSSSSPSATPSTAVPTARTFTGGTVYAACTGTQVMLTGRVPAPGYAIADVSPGPAASASVRFTSGSSADTVTVTCPGGRPAFTSTAGAVTPDDHGGNGGVDNDGGDNHGGRGGGPAGGGGGKGGDG